MPHVNPEKLFRGRSHRKGEPASDPRESGSKQYGERTIREYRDRDACLTDRFADDMMINTVSERL